MRIYVARWVLPIAGRPLRDGAVAVEGDRIVAVGPESSIRAASPAAETIDLGEAAILPSPVNAHTHVELSWLADDRPPAGDWVRWVEGLLERRGAEDPARVERAARAAIDGMRRRGTVAVGDVGNLGGTAPWLAAAGCHGVAFVELYGWRSADAERAVTEAAERLDRLADDPALAAGTLRVTLTPHAPHTTAPALLRALHGRAVVTGSPLSIHAAESAAEVRWLADGGGPLAALFARREFSPDGFAPPGMTPIEHLDRLGVLDERTLVVHGVHVGTADVERLQRRRATVVTCPRSNEMLGVGVAPVGRLLRAGIPVAIGTDSLASSPDLDVFAEMAALQRTHPELAPAAIVRMATHNGAVALGCGDRLGALEPGRIAAMVAIPLAGDADDPFAAACADPAEVRPLAAAADDAA